MAQIASGTIWKIGLLLFLRATIAAVNVGVALILRDIINAAMAHDPARFYGSAALLMGMICTRVGAGAANRFFQEDISAELENKSKKRLFAGLLEQDYGYISAVHSGEWMTRLTNDTVIVASAMTNLLPDMAAMAVRLLGAAGAILVMEPRFLYLLVPGAVLLIGASYLSRRKMKQLHKAVQEADGKLRSFLQECFSGMLVVRSYGAEETEISQAAGKMEGHRAARRNRNRFSNLCNTGFSIIMNGIYVAGACYCGYGILTDRMSYGTFMAVLQLTGQLQNPLANISGILPRYYAMLSSGERLLEAEAGQPQSRPERKSLEQVLHVYRSGLEKILLKGIGFSYLLPVDAPGENLGKDAAKVQALSGWNFEVRKGEYVAITGPSGSGKSTLLKLLMCLYAPDTGSRCLQISGEETPLDESWRHLFAYVPQGNYLMSGTIREVVRFSDSEEMQDDKALWQALSVACADGFVRQLDKGLDTQLGERGSGLSEGQMQRLAIARAVYSRCPVLILDECSSALDEETEAQLLRNLRSVTDRTVIIITHRPAALEICDRIWRVDDKLTLIQGESH